MALPAPKATLPRGRGKTASFGRVR